MGMGETIGSDLAISDGGSAAGAARRTGNGAHWVTGILSAMAGATVAIIVTDFRLQNVLGNRPQVLVADYGLFVNAVEQGVRADVVAQLANAYSARAAAVAAQGVLVLKGDALVAVPPDMVLAPDRQLQEQVLLVGAAGPRASGSTSVQPRPLMAPLQEVLAPSAEPVPQARPRPAESITDVDAAALSAVLRGAGASGRGAGGQ
jgi:hypothetical protein